jgi:hypothetical protein
MNSADCLLKSARHLSRSGPSVILGYFRVVATASGLLGLSRYRIANLHDIFAKLP